MTRIDFKKNEKNEKNSFLKKWVAFFPKKVTFFHKKMTFLTHFLISRFYQFRYSSKGIPQKSGPKMTFLTEKSGILCHFLGQKSTKKWTMGRSRATKLFEKKSHFFLRGLFKTSRPIPHKLTPKNRSHLEKKVRFFNTKNRLFYVKKVKKRVFFFKKVVFYPQKSENIDPIFGHFWTLFWPHFWTPF